MFPGNEATKFFSVPFYGNTVMNITTVALFLQSCCPVFTFRTLHWNDPEALHGVFLSLGRYFFPSFYLFSFCCMLCVPLFQHLFSIVFLSLFSGFLPLSLSNTLWWLEEEIGTGCPRLYHAVKTPFLKKIRGKKKSKRGRKALEISNSGSSLHGTSQSMIFQKSILKISIFAGMSSKKNRQPFYFPPVTDTSAYKSRVCYCYKYLKPNAWKIWE